MKIPSFRSDFSLSWQAVWSAGVGPQASSALMRWGLKGAIVVVNDWVGQASSPGTVLGGTGRSSTG